MTCMARSDTTSTRQAKAKEKVVPDPTRQEMRQDKTRHICNTKRSKAKQDKTRDESKKQTTKIIKINQKTKASTQSN